MEFFFDLLGLLIIVCLALEIWAQSDDLKAKDNMLLVRNGHIEELKKTIEGKDSSIALLARQVKRLTPSHGADGKFIGKAK